MPFCASAFDLSAYLMSFFLRVSIFVPIHVFFFPPRVAFFTFFFPPPRKSLGFFYVEWRFFFSKTFDLFFPYPPVGFVVLCRGKLYEIVLCFDVLCDV